jgi:hypothetical protein
MVRSPTTQVDHQHTQADLIFRQALSSGAVALVPVAIGIAVLRYRLYEIDRIISRTLAYALVTGLLGRVP